MPQGPAARVSDGVVHPLPPVLGPGPGSLNVVIGFLPAWRGVPAAAAASLQAAKQVSDAAIQAAEAATLAAAGTPGAPAAKAAEETVKATAAATMGSTITSAAGGADIHTCATPLPIPPHGPGVVIDGSPTVLINNLPACRLGDTILEAVGPPNKIAMGCPTVIIGNSGGGGGGSGGGGGGGSGGSGSGGSGGAPGSSSSAAAGGGTGPKPLPGLGPSAPDPDDLPESITLPDGLSKDMNDLWDKSFDADGNSQEHGGTLALDKDGNLVLVNKGSGNSGAFQPDTNVDADHKYVGTFHTHPYGKNDGSWDGAQMPFSDGDVSTIDDYKEKMSVVQSGDNVYVLVPTSKTPKNISSSDAEKAYNKSFNKEQAKQKADGKSDAEAASLAGEKATEDLAKKYDMGYYKGKNGGTLNRVNP